MSPEEQVAISRGEAAERIINDPVFIEAWEIVDRVFYDAWRNTAFNDVEGREAIKRAQSVGARFREAFEQILGDAHSAKAAVERALYDAD